MNRNSFNFTQPYWEFALPILSWLFLVPLLFWPELKLEGNAVTAGLIDLFSGWLTSNVQIYVVSSLSIMCLSWSVGSVISNHELLRKQNYLPAGLAAFLGAMSILTFGFSFSYLAVFFFIQGISSLMYVRRESKSYNHLFNSGFLLATGGLIDSHLWLALPFLLVGLLALRKFSVRDLLILSASVLNVLFLVSGIYVLAEGKLPEVACFYSCSQITFPQLRAELFYTLIGSVACLVLMGIGFSESYISVLSNRVKSRFRILMYFSLIIFALATIWNLMYNQLIECSFFIAPLSLAITVYATFITNKWLRRLMQLSFVVLVGLWIWFFFR